ncbi:hypothetical protein [Falsihalocynthiibacter arcticus]|uniref:hypothetical protein n=1 Tax=Falsihalocynthiibacter arcticus TaxID=1579316 RepID=UPI003001B8E1
MGKIKQYLNILPVPTGRAQDTNALKFDAELHCQMVRDLGQEGAFPAEWCAKIGIHRATLYRWANTYPEFEEALKVAWTLCQCWWEEKNRKSIDNKDAKTSLVIETLRKRFPHSWGLGAIDTEYDFERRPRDITLEEGTSTIAPTTEEISAMPDTEIQERIRLLQERLAHTKTPETRKEKL